METSCRLRIKALVTKRGGAQRTWLKHRHRQFALSSHDRLWIGVPRNARGLFFPCHKREKVPQMIRKWSGKKMKQESQPRGMANVWSSGPELANMSGEDISQGFLRFERINTGAAMKANSDVWIHLHADPRISNRVPKKPTRGHKSQMSKNGWTQDWVIQLGSENAKKGDKRRSATPSRCSENECVRTMRDGITDGVMILLCVNAV